MQETLDDMLDQNCNVTFLNKQIETAKAFSCEQLATYIWLVLCLNEPLKIFDIFTV